MRKRRSRGVWLPVIGHAITDPENEEVDISQEFAVDVPTDGSTNMGIVPLTFDTPQEQPNASVASDTMAELAGSEYIIKRILGHLHVANNSPYDNVNGGSHFAIKVDAGFFVARAGPDAGAPLGPDAPISFGVDSDADRQNYSPGHPATAREPWMWRRTWVLGNQRKIKFFEASAGSANVAPYGYFPAHNGIYPLTEGSRVDIKSRRRVRNDERLFLAVVARGLPINASVTGQLSVAYVLTTIRIFGSLVKAKGSGAF